MLTLDKIYYSARLLKDATVVTDILKAPKLLDNCNLYLKMENLQITGSFKVRGAYCKITQLSDEEKKKELSPVRQEIMLKGSLFLHNRREFLQ